MNKRWYKDWTAIAAAIVSLAACERAEARDLIEIETPYFTVVSALSESDTRGLIDQMRAFQSLLVTITTIRDLQPRVPLRIYLAGSYEWEKYLRPAKGIEGVMVTRPYVFTGVLNGQSWIKASRVLFHEYVHFALRNGVKADYPRWFDEGLAEFLSTVENNGKKIKLGVPPIDRLTDLDDFGGAHWIPLRDVLKLESRPENEDDSRTAADELGFYSESWALVHYSILAMPGGSKALIEFLRLRREGVTPEDAFVHAFNMSVEQMEGVLKRYVQGSRFPNVSADVSTLSLPDFGALKARQLSSSESTLEIGKMMTSLNPKSLLAYFDKFAKSEPKNEVALAAKASALALDEQFATAQSLLTQVLASKPMEPEILFIAGDIQALEAYSKRDDADRAEYLRLRRRAFDFYGEALNLGTNGIEDMGIVAFYANYALEFDTNLDGALFQVERVRKRYPKEPSFAAIDGKLLLKQHRLKDARDAWSVAADYGRGQQRIQALDTIDNIDAQMRTR